jgi:hypothetical protein
MTTSEKPEKLTYEAVMNAAGGVDFSSRIDEIAEYLCDGNEELAFGLALGMSILIEPIEDGRIVPDHEDFEYWLARQGLAAALQAASANVESWDFAEAFDDPAGRGELTVIETIPTPPTPLQGGRNG